MAKVASRSWIEAVKPALADTNSAPVHCHFVVPSNRERIAAALDWPASQQTIANMLLPRALLRSGASAWEQIESAHSRGEKVQIICGMRDPVARSISLIIFMADFYGHVFSPLNPRAKMSADYVTRYLQDNWQLVLEGKEPAQTFEWLLWYLTDAFRTWFDSELRAVCHVDVLDGVFRGEEASQQVRASVADIFIYRVEDMLPESEHRPQLLAGASEFLGSPVTNFPIINTNAARRSRELSEEVRRRFWLPDEVLDAIYSERVVEHFYSRDEIAEFKQRWSAARLQETKA